VRRAQLTARFCCRQIMMILFDDYGWADAGWHRVDVRTGEGTPDPDVQTPNMDQLVCRSSLSGSATA